MRLNGVSSLARSPRRREDEGQVSCAGAARGVSVRGVSVSEGSAAVREGAAAVRAVERRRAVEDAPFVREVREAFDGSASWNGLGDAGKVLEGALQGGVRAVETAVTQKVASVAASVAAEMGRTAWEVMGGAIQNLAEGLLQFFRGAGRLLGGDMSGGLRDLGVGLFKAFIQTPIDAVLLGGGKLVGAVQTALGVEPAGRGLSIEEIATLRRVFGDSVDYARVQIKEGSAGLFSANARPFTLGDTIYLKREPMTERLLVHEMVHVWQFQNGGSDYLSEAVASQWWGHGYDWKASVPGTPFGALEPEQQAELLETAFAAGAFDLPPRRFVSGGVDYDDYLALALDDVRHGRGAP